MGARIIRHVVICGHVQGVGFRDWTRYVATERGIEGWVRNRRDGSVEAVFAGTQEAITSMLAACRKGPSHALVESVEEREGTADDLALRGDKAFALLPTL